MPNWWVHRFVSGGDAMYKINQSATMFGEDMCSPDSAVGYTSIEQAEAALRNMGIENGQTWYIHRSKKHNAADQAYTVDHSSSNSSYHKTCPGAPPGYATIIALADGLMLSTLHNTGACG